MSLTKEEANEAIKKYIEEMKDVYFHLLSYIDDSDSSAEEEYQNLINVIEKYAIQQDKEKFNHFIELLINVFNNHTRQNNLIEKIERILLKYSNSIKENNNNFRIFEKFSNNKRLLYFLIKKQILVIDTRIAKLIEGKIESNGIRYSDFFLFELPKSDNDKIDDDETKKYYKEHFEEYEEKRKAGENDSYICSLIRQNSVEEFIKYINRANISPSSSIKPSIFESNSILNGKDTTLIEYAAFYGSIDIFQYLYKSNADIEGSIWLYAIHSNNSELLLNYIHSNKIEPDDTTFEESFKESIKCHHNDFANYFQDNFIDENKITFNELAFDHALKYHNHLFASKLYDQDFAFYRLSKYNYQYIVDLLIQSQKDKIEEKIIIKPKRFFFLIKFMNSIQ